ncbi:MAG: hypothetical protein EBQ57_00370 [Actinobacteria bacterium]|nr:hypothetical protein [Actinomycetota bacterium]
MVQFLFVKLGSNPETRPIVEKIRSRIPGCRILGVEERLDASDSVFDEIITSHDDALFGSYSKFDLTSLHMSAELYEEVRVFEGQAMRMIDRIKYHNQAEYIPPLGGVGRYSDSFDARADLIFRHSLFWDYILRSRKIDAVVSQNFSHLGFDLPLVKFCQNRSIPHLIFHDVGQFPGVLYVQERVEDLGNLRLGESIRSICGDRLMPETPNRVTSHLPRLLGDPALLHPANTPSAIAQGSRFKTGALSSLLNQANPRLEVNTASDVANALRGKLTRLIQHPGKTLVGSTRTFMRIVRTRRSMKDEAAFSDKAIPNCKFVYFPLHFQPEASTSAKGRHFVDQREAVALVASTLPVDWMLVVKEHPHQWRRLYPRHRNYWRRIASIPRVRVIHHTFENPIIVQRCEGVVSISHSSIGVESWARGKRVVFLGDSHLREAPGVCCASSAEELRQLWANDAKHLPSETEIFSYLQRVEYATFEGALYGTPAGIPATMVGDFLLRTQHNITEVILCWLAMKGLTKQP